MWAHNSLYQNNKIYDKHSQNIKKLIGDNVIVYGPQGAGIFTMVSNALSIDSTDKWNPYTITINNDKSSLNIMTRQSYIHFEIFMQDFGNNDRYVVKNLINEISNKMIISLNGDVTLKIMVIHNIEYFSKESQNVLCTFVEKHVTSTRFLFTTSKFNNISRKLISRCVLYRVPRPNGINLLEHLQMIHRHEGYSLDDETLMQIIQQHNNHVDDTINHMQLICMGIKPSIVDLYNKLIDHIIRKDSIKSIRTLIYQLLVSNIKPTNIIKHIADRLSSVWSSEKMHKVYHKAALYEWRLCICERAIYHIEAFLIALMYD